MLSRWQRKVNERRVFRVDKMLAVWIFLLHVAASRTAAQILSKEVHADHSVTLDCNFPPTESLSVFWVFTSPESTVDRRILKLSGGEITKDGNVEWRGNASIGNAALRIIRARMSDVGRYRCKIYKGVILVWERIIELRVHRNQKREVIPQVNVDVNGFVGDNILLPCKVPAGGELDSVKWEKNTKMLFYYTPSFPINGQKDPKVKWVGDLVRRNASAVLLNASAADSGGYKCEVLGDTGTVLMVNVHVTVETRTTTAVVTGGGGGGGVGGVTVSGVVTVSGGGGGGLPTEGNGPSNVPPHDDRAPNNTKWWIVLVCLLILHIAACLLLFSYMRRKGFKFEKKPG
ncbi:CD226 antigen-like, partial [Lampetra fluviatilis]